MIIIKNRKGSTLILVLMVFAVLMIFAIFTVGFMVTENKQSLYHQHKTQAYYIARSGAVAVEAAILKMDEHELEKLDDKLEGVSNLTVNIENLEFGDENTLKVSITRKNDSLFIESIGRIGTTEERVQKVMARTVEKGNDEITIKGPPIIALSSLSNNIGEKVSGKPETERYIYYDGKRILVAIIDKDTEYGTLQFPTDINWNGDSKYKKLDSKISSSLILGEEGKTTNYVVNGNLSIDLDKHNTFNIKGIVNIFIKNGLDISIKGEEKNNSGEDKNNLNFYVSEGDINIFFENKGGITSNIITYSSGNVKIGTQSNSEKTDFIGSIYAPKRTVNIGYDKAAILYKGVILGHTINLKTNNENKDKSFLKLLVTENDRDTEIVIPVAKEKDSVQYSKGYFK